MGGNWIHCHICAGRRGRRGSASQVQHIDHINQPPSLHSVHGVRMCVVFTGALQYTCRMYSAHTLQDSVFQPQILMKYDVVSEQCNEAGYKSECCYPGLTTSTKQPSFPFAARGLEIRTCRQKICCPRL